ncbi:MAG TPA: hypothetical protein VJN96_12795 [Vicinamibacterales bacterium]|nr:hypothetical protein [Vicinamibacterales bacterium]
MPLVMAVIVFVAVAVGQHANTPPAPTRVVRFTPPAAANGSARPGTCQRSLVSDRADAYRCVAETTYDPCFALERAGLVLCNADPRDAASGTVVTVPPPGPSASGPRGVNLRAWFFELEDGSTCRPLIAGAGREVDGMVELYTCRFAPPGSDAVLGEIDTHAPVWTVQQVSLNKRAPPLSIKQLVSAVVKTAWQ